MKIILFIFKIRTAAEIHLVHFNSKYASEEEAQRFSDGIAVLAVMIVVSIDNNPTFDPVINHLRDVTHANDTIAISEELDLDDILPEDFQSFYRYSGSLTTPKCDEVVTWTVFSNPNLMSSSQLRQFRTLTNDENKPLVNNDRPVQPMGNRVVQFYSQRPTAKQGGKYSKSRRRPSADDPPKESKNHNKSVKNSKTDPKKSHHEYRETDRELKKKKVD